MIRVVLADDHQLFLDGLKRILDLEQEIEVIAEAHNGKELARVLEEKSCDILLLDINMPGQDGMIIASKILDTYPEIKILLVTMHNKLVLFEQAIKIGVHGYLLKSVSQLEMINAIKTVSIGEEYYSAEMTKKVLNKIKQETSNTFKITKRETEVLKFVAEGKTTSEIAKKLFISPETVRTHRKSLLSKSGAKNSLELVKWARENDYVL